MTDSEPRPEESQQAPPAADDDKLDLASVAAQLAAKSRELEGDPAVEPTPEEEPASEEEPTPEQEPAAEEEPAPEEQTAAQDEAAAPVEEEGAPDPGEEAEAQAAPDPDPEPGPQPGPEPDLTVGARELSGGEVYAVVEALLFAADGPVTAAQMARVLPGEVNAREVRKQLAAIAEELAGGERGFELREIAGGWQLLTREKFAPYVAKLKRTAGPRKLSGSALETLAVVAYKQPVVRAEIERIRGVACGDMLRNLMEKRLVRITGRSQELGSPLLYGTTSDFLNHFDLASLSDLPRSAELGRKPKPSEPAVTPPAEGDAAKTPAEDEPQAEAEADARDASAEGEVPGA